MDDAGANLICVYLIHAFFRDWHYNMNEAGVNLIYDDPINIFSGSNFTI